MDASIYGYMHSASGDVIGRAVGLRDVIHVASASVVVLDVNPDNPDIASTIAKDTQAEYLA